jgi:hypothetical protein
MSAAQQALALAARFLELGFELITDDIDGFLNLIRVGFGPVEAASDGQIHLSAVGIGTMLFGMFFQFDFTAQIGFSLREEFSEGGKLVIYESHESG